MLSIRHGEGGLSLAEAIMIALAGASVISLGGALAAGAVGAADPSLLLYPIYYCMVNGAIAVLILCRRAVLRRPRIPSSPPGRPLRQLARSSTP